MPKTFKQKVLAVVKKIPKGKTLSYQEVAKRAGSARAYRAVGNTLSKNYDSKICCHRVIRTNGKVGGYSRGVKKKKELLKKEIRVPFMLIKLRIYKHFYYSLFRLLVSC